MELRIEMGKKGFDVFDIEKIFVKNGDEIGKMIKNGSSISNAPKWISCIKNIFSEITNVVTRR